MRIFVPAAALLATCSLMTGTPASAAEPAVTDFTKTTCAELAGDTEENRAYALMFDYGYMAGRSNEATLQDAKVPGHLAAVRDYCNANRTSTVVQAFVNALRGTK